MNIVDKLLKFDAGLLETPTKDVVLKLGKLGGAEFTFPCKALNARLMAEIQESQAKYEIKKKGGAEMKISMFQAKLKRIVAGCPTVFKDESVISHFNARTPFDLVEILLLPGEIDDLANVIDDLSGFELEDDEDSIEDSIENL